MTIREDILMLLKIPKSKRDKLFRKLCKKRAKILWKEFKVRELEEKLK